jgi:hypothetical protein
VKGTQQSSNCSGPLGGGGGDLLLTDPAPAPDVPQFTFEHSHGTKSRFRRDVLRAIRESDMAGLYLGIAVTGVNALVATALVIACM